MLLGVALLFSGCAARGAARNPQYPPRAPGCKLAMTGASTPGVAAWDDLGVAEVPCHISTAIAQCMSQLRAQACRMGGDLLYNIPARPLRPRDEILLFRGQVAHTRAGDAGAAKKEKADEEPAPDNGPVVPIGSRPPATSDGGSG